MRQEQGVRHRRALVDAGPDCIPRSVCRPSPSPRPFSGLLFSGSLLFHAMTPRRTCGIPVKKSERRSVWDRLSTARRIALQFRCRCAWTNDCLGRCRPEACINFVHLPLRHFGSFLSYVTKAAWVASLFKELNAVGTGTFPAIPVTVGPFGEVG